MPLFVTDVAPAIETFKTIITDMSIMDTFISMEIGTPDEDGNPFIIMRDQTFIAAGDEMYARELMKPSWLLFFQIGGGAASLKLAQVCITDMDALIGPLEDIFKKPKVSIHTERSIMSEVDTSESIAFHESRIIIPTSFLRIYAVRSDNYNGTWSDDPDFKNGATAIIQTPLDMIKDKRDKTL